MTQAGGNITHLERLSFHNSAGCYFWQFLGTKQALSCSLHLQINHWGDASFKYHFRENQTFSFQFPFQNYT